MKKSLSVLFTVIFSLFLVQTTNIQAQQVHQIIQKDVPNLIGLTEAEALIVLKATGISYQKAYITAVEAEYDGKEGKVVRQSPTVGKKVSSRQKVWIYIYSPMEQTTVTPIQPIIEPVEVTFKNIDLKWTDRAYFHVPSYDEPTLVATLTNGGRDATPRGKLEWQVQLFDEGNKKIYDKTDSLTFPLGGGKSEVVNFKYIPLNIYKNTDMIKLIANPNKKVIELNKNNNTVIQKNLPDLSITRMWIEDGDYNYRIIANINNIGARPLQGSTFSFTWYFDNVQKPANKIRLDGDRCKISYGISKNRIPQDQKKILVKLHINDGLSIGKIYEELDYDNNVLEVELELPDR